MYAKIAATAVAIGLACAHPAAAQPGLPSINFCAAKKGGNYDFAAQQIAVQAKGLVRVNVINTNGSLDILAKLDDGSCDVGIVQSDALTVYKDKNSSSALSLEIGAALYPELLHLICNKEAGLSKITGLTKEMTVFIGENGSGTSVTWDSFKIADPKRYGNGGVSTVPLSGVRALGKVVLGGEQGTCLMYVAGLKTADMLEANDKAKQSGKLMLVPTDDSDLLKLKTPGKNGTYMYTKAEIPSGTYPGGLQPASLFGSSVQTIAVTATFVASTKYVDAHSTEYDNVLRAVNNAIPAINKRVRGE